MPKLLGFALVALVVMSAPAAAQLTDFTGSLSLFVDTGSGLPATATPIFGLGTGALFAADAGSFTIPAGVFTRHTSSAVGFTANASPNSIYTIRNVTNSSNLTGTFAGTPGTGPYGGVMDLGSSLTVELGIVPLLTVLGSFAIPLRIGAPGTVTAMGAVLTNAITVSVIGTGWTTGSISLVTNTISPPSSAIFSGSNTLDASGGRLSLVTPFMVILSGTTNQTLPGYARLSLNFANPNRVPEPRAVLLLMLSAGFLAAGRRASRR